MRVEIENWKRYAVGGEGGECQRVRGGIDGKLHISRTRNCARYTAKLRIKRCHKASSFSRKLGRIIQAKLFANTSLRFFSPFPSPLTYHKLDRKRSHQFGQQNILHKHQIYTSRLEIARKNERSSTAVHERVGILNVYLGDERCSMLRQDDKILQPKRTSKIEIALPGDGSCTGNKTASFLIIVRDKGEKMRRP